MFLADGREVPDRCIQALESLEERWPGATLKQAHGAIAAAVTEAAGPVYEKKELSADEFVRQINEPEGFLVLISDIANLRYELHVYRENDVVVYISPLEKMDEMTEFIKKLEDVVKRGATYVKHFAWYP